MAVPWADTLSEQRAQLLPHAEKLMAFVRQVDAEVTFSFDPPIDPGIWLLRAYVTPPLDSDLDFQDELAECEANVQMEHEVSICTIPLPRKPIAD